jgi:hypothetical protein
MSRLDSRQRKKQHTDSLEQDKKMWLLCEKDLKDRVTHLENIINHEQQRMVQMREQYEAHVTQVLIERDNIVRKHTLEAAELRRQNNVLKDCVKDLERQQASRSYPSSHTPNDAFASDFSSFGNLDLGDDHWDDEFSLINGEDLKMDGEESPQRQMTPRPLPPPQDVAAAPTPSEKVDSSITLNTICMCLLFGAFMASRTDSSASKLAGLSDAAEPSSSAHPSVPALPTIPDDYRAEASNIVKAVLANGEDALHAIIPGSEATYSMSSSLPPNQPRSSLDALSTTLTTPSRQQEAVAAFSLTPAQYEHITNPGGILDTPPASDTMSPQHLSHQHKATPLQAMFAAVQEERDQVDRLTGLGDKIRERSVLLERVSPKVLRDFRALVAETEAKKKAP